MLLNLSNHPSSSWPDKQLKLAIKQFERVQDLAFPQIAPEQDENALLQLASNYFDKIIAIKPSAVHVMGEMTFCLALVSKLIIAGIPCFASTTHRVSQVLPDGSKVSKFEFVRFRQYRL